MKQILLMLAFMPFWSYSQDGSKDSVQIQLGDTKIKTELPAMNKQNSFTFKDSNSIISIRIDRLPLSASAMPMLTPEPKKLKVRKYFNEAGVGMMFLTNKMQYGYFNDTFYTDTIGSRVSIDMKKIKPGVQFSLALRQTYRQLSEKVTLSTGTLFKVAIQNSEGYYKGEAYDYQHDSVIGLAVLVSADSSEFRMNRTIYQLCFPFVLDYKINEKWSAGFGMNLALSATSLRVIRSQASNYNMLEKRIDLDRSYRYPGLQLQPCVRLTYKNVSLSCVYDFAKSRFGSGEGAMKQGHFTTVGLSYRFF